MNYHEVLGIDAYRAEQIIERDDGYVTIPKNIVFGEFAQAAFDNAGYDRENACYQYRYLSVLPQWRV